MTTIDEATAVFGRATADRDAALASLQEVRERERAVAGVSAPGPEAGLRIVLAEIALREAEQTFDDASRELAAAADEASTADDGDELAATCAIDRLARELAVLFAEEEQAWNRLLAAANARCERLKQARAAVEELAARRRHRGVPPPLFLRRLISSDIAAASNPSPDLLAMGTNIRMTRAAVLERLADLGGDERSTSKHERPLERLRLEEQRLRALLERERLANEERLKEVARAQDAKRRAAEEVEQRERAEEAARAQKRAREVKEERELADAHRARR